jgi:hypothetical protein
MLAAVGIWTLAASDISSARSEPRASSPASAVRAHQRDEALRHARTRLGPSTSLGASRSTSLGASPSTPLGASRVERRALTSAPPDPTGMLTGDTVSCQFVPRVPDGTTSKFDCTLTSGEIVRVKYGREPEIHAEAAATRLLSALGYAADHIYLVPRLRCHGCPTSNPFATMHFLDVLRAPADLSAVKPLREGEYTDFEWVGVERKFDATPIEDDRREGWAWWELKQVSAPADDLDALRLLAIFLAHWDNKSENQRLVCMDAGYDASAGACRDSLLMISDLGATFGPAKVNLSQWRETPVWIDRATCTVSMRMLPFGGSTFTDARVTEAARLRVGHELASFSDDELRQWFSAARFPQFYAATDDGKDLNGWIRAYRSRVTQMLNAGPCPS